MKMNKEDYFKYYIQGSDHYLIPRNIFEELFDEMSNWREEVKELKEKYLNAVADYETTMFEKEQLNSLVNSCQEEIRQLKKQLEEYKHKGLYNTCLSYSTGYKKAIKEKENQQKEFIEYMNKTIEELECDDVGDEELKCYLIQRIDTFKEILSKYKEIIGENNGI